jgi:FtsZ-interacting cell division protein ZipA
VNTFTVIVIVGLVVVVGTLVALGLWHPARAMEITDKDRQERWATQAEIEETEVDQMVEGQNVYHRAHGEEEITAGDMQRRAAERQQEGIEQAKRRVTERDEKA